MSFGITLLIGVASVFALLFGLQMWMGFNARKLEGEPAPALPGALGERVGADVVLWFHSPNCGPCRAMEPTAETLAQQGSVEIVDVMQRPEVARAFNVMATPTTVKIRDGQVQQVHMGFMAPGQFHDFATA